MTVAAVSVQTLLRAQHSASTMPPLELADGTTVTRQKGGAVFKYRDDLGVADVIFGEKGDATLLGAFSLEALGLALDPIRRTLTPATLFM